MTDTGPGTPPPPPGPGRADERFLKVEEVAAMWSVDKKSVYQRIYHGELPWIDLRAPGAKRARIRVRLSAAVEFMTSRERRAA